MSTNAVVQVPRGKRELLGVGQLLNLAEVPLRRFVIVQLAVHPGDGLVERDVLRHGPHRRLQIR